MPERIHEDSNAERQRSSFNTESTGTTSKMAIANAQQTAATHKTPSLSAGITATTNSAAMSAIGAGQSLPTASSTVAAPISAGSAGADGTIKDSAAAAAGLGASPDSFNINGITMDTENWAGTMNVLGNTVALGRSGSTQGDSISFNNINIPNANNRIFSLANAKIDSIVFNKKTGFQRATISAGAVTIGKNTLKIDGLQAQLNHGQSEYNVITGAAQLRIWDKSIGLDNLNFRLSANGEFLSAGATNLSTQDFEAQSLSIQQEDMAINDVTAQLPPILGATLNAKFQNLAYDKEQQAWSGQGNSIDTNETLSLINDRLKRK